MRLTVSQKGGGLYEIEQNRLLMDAQRRVKTRYGGPDVPDREQVRQERRTPFVGNHHHVAAAEAGI